MLIKPYFRRSKADKKRRVSIELQRAELERWLSENPGWTALPAGIDDGKSAFEERPERRPEFKALMDGARAKEFEAIWCYMYDRFSRKLALSAPFLEELERLGIRVISATEPEDWESRAQASLDAEKFSRRLSMRMKGVKYFQAQQGYWVGAVPFGYDRVEGILVPNGDAWIVKLIFELYATNRYAIMDIVDELKARGLQYHTICRNDDEPYDFGGTSIRQILTKRAYLGEVVCGNITVPNAHPALVGLTTWETVQTIRYERAKTHGRVTVQAPDRGIMASIARCAICGGSLWHAKSGKGLRTYTCGRRRQHHACDARDVNTDTVDRYMLHILARLRLPEDWQHQALALIQPNTPPTPPDVAAVEREMRLLRAEFIDGAMTPEAYRAREARLRAMLVPVPATPTVDLGHAAALLADLPRLIIGATADEQRALVRTIFSTVWLRASVIEAWAPRAVYQPLFTVLYDLTNNHETRGGSSPPKAFATYPALWAGFQAPLALGGA